MIRIRWTDEERALVVERMVYLLNKMPMKYSKKGLIISACAVLPEVRRRRVFTNVEINEMNTKAYALASDSLKTMISKAEIAVEQHAVLPLPEKKDDLAALLEALVDKIADKVSDKVIFRLVDQMQAIQSTECERRPKHNPEPPCSAPREPRIGVLILGMQPHQGNLLKQEFPKLDITCYDSDEARTKPVIQRAHTIGMTRFLSHQVEDRYKKCPRYHRHAQGTSELKTLLQRIERGEV